MSIIDLVKDMRVREKLEALQDPDSKDQFVKDNNDNKRFMKIAVRHDRRLFRHADPTLAKDKELIAIALQPVLAMVDLESLEPRQVAEGSKHVVYLSWHSAEKDREMRKQFMRTLGRSLLEARAHAPVEWYTTFQKMIKELEYRFYLGSFSKDHYCNISTIPQRLRKLYYRLKPLAAPSQ